jgi:hypothetical protein
MHGTSNDSGSATCGVEEIERPIDENFRMISFAPTGLVRVLNAFTQR